MHDLNFTLTMLDKDKVCIILGNGLVWEKQKAINEKKTKIAIDHSTLPFATLFLIKFAVQQHVNINIACSIKMS